MTRSEFIAELDRFVASAQPIERFHPPGSEVRGAVVRQCNAADAIIVPYRNMTDQTFASLNEAVQRATFRRVFEVPMSKS